MQTPQISLLDRAGPGFYSPAAAQKYLQQLGRWYLQLQMLLIRSPRSSPGLGPERLNAKPRCHSETAFRHALAVRGGLKGFAAAEKPQAVLCSQFCKAGHLHSLYFQAAST